LEQKRQSVLSQFKNVEEMIQIGEVQLSNPRITELKRLREEIHWLKKELKRQNSDRENTKRALVTSELRAKKLAAELKKSR
jgi:hypothetical protein